MKRIIDHYLGEWKQRTDRKALLLRGARQVGKTYAVRELGMDEKRGRTPYGIRFCGQPSSIHGDLHSYAMYAVPHVLRGQIPHDWF